MKTKISSALRTKKRYILFSSANREEIEKIILDGIGVLGWAKARPVFVEDFKNRGESKGEGKCILAVDRKYLNDVRAAFAVAESEIKILRVSGTLKGLLGK